MTNNFYSTDGINPGKFRPHGRVEYEEQGNILWTRAWGPFNVELVEALNSLVRDIFPGMASKGAWVNICTFEHSALASFEVLENFSELVKQLVQLKIAPAAVAFVLPRDIEGAFLMAPLYAKCIIEGGVPFESFSNSEPAERWAGSFIGMAGS
jgi:hypothetical protein